MTRLQHCKKTRLCSEDVNDVITSLCDADPVLGAPDATPEYHNEAKVFVPHEHFINLYTEATESLNISQNGLAFLHGKLLV